MARRSRLALVGAGAHSDHPMEMELLFAVQHATQSFHWTLHFRASLLRSPRTGTRPRLGQMWQQGERPAAGTQRPAAGTERERRGYQRWPRALSNRRRVPACQKRSRVGLGGPNPYAAGELIPQTICAQELVPFAKKTTFCALHLPASDAHKVEGVAKRDPQRVTRRGDRVVRSRSLISPTGSGSESVGFRGPAALPARRASKGASRWVSKTRPTLRDRPEKQEQLGPVRLAELKLHRPDIALTVGLRPRSDASLLFRRSREGTNHESPPVHA